MSEKHYTEAELKALESIPVTEEQVAEFMAEWNRGEHRISEDDEAALERSRALLMAQLELMRTHPQSFSE